MRKDTQTQVAVVATGKYAAERLKNGAVVVADTPDGSFQEFMNGVAFALGAAVVKLEHGFIYIPDGCGYGAEEGAVKVPDEAPEKTAGAGK